MSYFAQWFFSEEEALERAEDLNRDCPLELIRKENYIVLPRSTEDFYTLYFMRIRDTMQEVKSFDNLEGKMHAVYSFDKNIYHSLSVPGTEHVHSLFMFGYSYFERVGTSVIPWACYKRDIKVLPWGGNLYEDKNWLYSNWTGNTFLEEDFWEFTKRNGRKIYIPATQRIYLFDVENQRSEFIQLDHSALVERWSNKARSYLSAYARGKEFEWEDFLNSWSKTELENLVVSLDKKLTCL